MTTTTRQATVFETASIEQLVERHGYKDVIALLTIDAIKRHNRLSDKAPSTKAYYALMRERLAECVAVMEGS